MEFTLLGATLVAVGALWMALRFFGGPRIDQGAARGLVDLAVGAIGSGILVGRLAAMIGTGTNPLTSPGDILIIRGGVATGWAALGALGALAFAVRRQPARSLDTIAAPALFGLAGWHAGCLVRGACAGTSSDLPWAMAAGSGGSSRHPVELYAALLLVLAALAIRRVPVGAGRAAGLALAAAGLVRLATEPMRVSLGGGPKAWYLAAAVIGLGVAVAAPRILVRAHGPADP